MTTFWIFGNFLATFWHPSKQLYSILRSQLGQHILKAVVNPGPWTLDSRLWTLDPGLWTNPLPPPPKKISVDPRITLPLEKIHPPPPFKSL